MSTGRKVSLREIARLCNLSPTTVSRIANGTGTFTEETRRLVFDTMARTGYQPKSAERTAPEKPGPAIGCLVSDYTNEVFCSRLSVMEQYFREKGVCLLSCETHRDVALEATLAKRLQQLGVFGIITMGVGAGLRSGNLPLPVIYMDIRSEELEQSANAYPIASDDYVGGQLAAQELYCKGCRKPLILNIRYVPIKENGRIQGFVDRFAEYGITIESENILPPDMNKSSFNSAKDLIAYHRTKGTEFDSVFACSDWRAYGALVALRNMGVRVPDEVKIVGYDGIQVSRYCDTPITTIQQDSETLAATACDMMWQLMNGKAVDQRQVLVPVHLQEGKTT